MSTKTKSKSDLLAKLAKVAPSISIRIIWEHDCDMIDIRKHCCGFDDEDPDDWQAWQSEVQAVAIIDGAEVSGSDYLGGTWEKACDHPSQSNPEISGYLPGMIGEALRDLVKQLPVIDTDQTIELREEIQSALASL